MFQILKIAWRNLWRNKRRTIITIASIYFATLIAILTRAFQLGYYNYAINSLIEHYSGHIQIQQKDYFRNPSINNLMPYSSELYNILFNDRQIKFFTPRLQNNALLWANGHSTIGLILGVNPVKENQISDLKDKIAHYKIDSLTLKKLKPKIPSNLFALLKKNLTGYYTDAADLEKNFLSLSKDFKPFLKLIECYSGIKGRYIHAYENAVVIGSGLADKLHLSVGDSLVVISQGYHGASAVGKFPVVGILHFPNPQFNNMFVYMPLSSAQSLFSAFTYDKSGNPVGLVSYVTINTIYKASINPADYLMIKRVINDLRRKINNPDINILGWHQLNKQMYQEIMTDNVGGLLMLLILFVIIGIGVFGTVLMMTLERKKEFGILLAIGMSRAKLINMLLWEMLLITLLSIFLAIITSLPIVIYGHSHPIFLGAKYAKAFAMFNLQPIMPLASPGLYMIVQPLIIFLIIMLTVIYPVLFLSKLKVTKALHD